MAVQQAAWEVADEQGTFTWRTLFSESATDAVQRESVRMDGNEGQTIVTPHSLAL